MKVFVELFSFKSAKRTVKPIFAKVLDLSVSAMDHQAPAVAKRASSIHHCWPQALGASSVTRQPDARSSAANLHGDVSNDAAFRQQPPPSQLKKHNQFQITMQPCFTSPVQQQAPMSPPQTGPSKKPSIFSFFSPSASPSKRQQTTLSPPQTGPSKTSSVFSFFTPSKSFGRLSNAAQASPSRSIKLASLVMQAAANSAGGVAAGA